jgi:hypothetical protein
MVPTPCRSGLFFPGSSFDPGCGLQLPAATDAVPSPAREATIGVVVFLTHKKEPAEAILDVAGTWHCPKLPVLDRVLNALYGPRRGAGGALPFGHAELIRVAAWLKGEARLSARSRATARDRSEREVARDEADGASPSGAVS